MLNSVKALIPLIASFIHLIRRSSCGIKEVGKVKASWIAKEELSGVQIHHSMFLDHGPTRTIDFINTFYDQEL